MNYATGESIKLGDKVSLGDDSDGEVVIIFDTNEYSQNYPEVQWGGYLGKGVMVNFPLYGLIYYENALEDPDLKLIARGSIPA
jgi:hypothetical protein